MSVYQITVTEEFLEDLVKILNKNDPKIVYKNIQLHKNDAGKYSRITVDIERTFETEVINSVEAINMRLNEIK
jgi:putative lipoic acid-binding regulatory protein